LFIDLIAASALALGIIVLKFSISKVRLASIADSFCINKKRSSSFVIAFAPVLTVSKLIEMLSISWNNKSASSVSPVIFLFLI
jgi:hypothetical protein